MSFQKLSTFNSGWEPKLSESSLLQQICLRYFFVRRNTQCFCFVSEKSQKQKVPQPSRIPDMSSLNPSKSIPTTNPNQHHCGFFSILRAFSPRVISFQHRNRELGIFKVDDSYDLSNIFVSRAFSFSPPRPGPIDPGGFLAVRWHQLRYNLFRLP